MPRGIGGRCGTVTVDVPAGWLRTAAELAAVVVAYRLLVSPVVRWAALRLGAGVYPDPSPHGTYPAAPSGRRAVLSTAAVLAALTGAAFAVGARPSGPPAMVEQAALAVVLWKHLTLDYDAAHDLSWQRVDRLMVLAVGGAGLVWPPLHLAAVVAVCGRLGGWTHHSKAALRMLKAGFCWSPVAGVATAAAGQARPGADTSAHLLLLATVFLSHYVVACGSKLRLGARPWHWIVHNRTDLLAASAYAWGWCRFLPEHRVARAVGALRRVTVVLNAATILIEGLGPAAFASRSLALAAVLGAIAFNAVVAATSGLLFLENIAVGAALAAALLQAPAAAFGAFPALLAGALYLLVLAGGAWRPTGLGWWDTPFTARVHWTGRTVDGRLVGIHNDVLCPHDREFGRAVGNVLTDEPFVTFSLGGVEDAALRDRLLKASRGEDSLPAIKQAHGHVHATPGARARHAAYLRALFTRLHSGVPKSPLPRGLRRLKAPGSHLYYWGDLPRYRPADGPLRSIQVRYRETCYRPQARRWDRLRDDLLFEIPLTAAPGPQRGGPAADVAEPTAPGGAPEA
jgi:hypothetical protein